MKNLIILGAGDVGKFLAYNQSLFEEQYNLLGFWDEDPAKVGTRLCGLPVLGMEYLDAAAPGTLHAAVAMSCPAAKRAVTEKLRPYGLHFPNFIARGSWLSGGITLGQGVIIYPNCSIAHETVIGNFVTVNAGCTLGHNTQIGDYANLSPGVHLAGFTRVGELADLGIGCCTRQRTEIGARSVVGGQAMLIDNVEPGRTVVGVPAIPKK